MCQKKYRVSGFPAFVLNVTKVLFVDLPGRLPVIGAVLALPGRLVLFGLTTLVHWTCDVEEVNKTKNQD